MALKLLYSLFKLQFHISHNACRLGKIDCQVYNQYSYMVSNTSYKSIE